MKKWVYRIGAGVGWLMIFSCFATAPVCADEKPMEWVETVFELQQPIDVRQLILYKDGGTVGGILEGNGGTFLSFCLDGRVENNKPQRILVGATHPTSDHGRVLDVGGNEEKELLELLHTWLDEQMPPRKRERFKRKLGNILFSERERNMQLVMMVVEVLEEREKAADDEQPNWIF